MSSLQQRIATVADTTANLIAQLRELDRLRDQVRDARLSSGKLPQPKPRNGNGGISRSYWESTNREPAFSGSAPAAHRKAAALG